MEKKVHLVVPAFILCAAFLLSDDAFGKQKQSWVRSIDPIVSTDWLYENLDEKNLVILDIRTSTAYAAGHIPSSINEPFGLLSPWATIREGLIFEVPDAHSLFESIGSLGITNESQVVIVTDHNYPNSPPFFGLSFGSWVGLTLIYAGVKNVAILDGGYSKWAAEGQAITIDKPAVVPSEYDGRIDHTILVPIEYVKKHLHRADIIDAVDADMYFGVTIDPYADKQGHIPTAVSLPAPWMWTLDETGTYYTYKDPETLGAMASGVLREPWGDKARQDQEIIVYCGVGLYGSSLWFVLTQVLGYENVAFYQGSAQEWSRYYDMVMYRWE